MRKYLFGVLFMITFMVVVQSGCEVPAQSTGVGNTSNEVKKVDVKVTTDKDGMTVEQKNIAKRLLEDNKVGSIKHMYVLSAYSGQVLIYSTVSGKVTSSGKRLTPNTVCSTDGQYVDRESRGFPINFNGSVKYTSEVLQDDGSYGHSGEYLYWWDTKGVYHQHYLSGGQIVHISDQPLAVKNIIINMNVAGE